MWCIWSMLIYPDQEIQAPESAKLLRLFISFCFSMVKVEGGEVPLIETQ